MAFESLDIFTFRIECLLSSSNIILDPPTRQILESAHNEVKSVGAIAARMKWRGLQRLEGEIDHEASKLVSKFEEAIRSHVSKLKIASSAAAQPSGLKEVSQCFMGKSKKLRLESKLEDKIQSRFSKRDCTDQIREDWSGWSTDARLHGLNEEIQVLVGMVKKMEEDYADALYNPSFLDQAIDKEEEEADDHDEVEMVGLSDQYRELKRKLFEGNFFQVLPLVGMAGIGKTTLATKIFGDADVVKRFRLRVWVRIGRNFQLKQIPRHILAKVGPTSARCSSWEDIDGADERYLREILKGKRYLIVLEDVWERNVVYHLHSLLSGVRDNGSRVLLTTRLQQGDDDVVIRLMDKDESWDLLRGKVFGGEPCPTLLEEAGKKIAENCDGLPLTIVSIADKLSKSEKAPTLKYWSEVAAKKNHRIFKDVYDEISKVLRPSYDYLPRLLQLCFLYMGVFPQNFEIPRSKLISMWDVDGFLVRNVKFDAILCLEELVTNSVAMIYVKSTGATSSVGVKEIKRCGLHSSFWYLAIREARKIKFCQVLNSIDDGLDKGILIGQQRLSFHNNILFCIKDVHALVMANCASSTRSLLCYGPYHQYQVSICFGLRLLRELDSLAIRFYEFPMEVLGLVQLRYLAFTLDGKLPASISKLSKLRFLVVGRHFVVKFCRNQSYLPVEIWDMKELQHVSVMGSDLPDPCGALLENMSTLSNVSVLSCAKGVLKAIPNLGKLGVRIELAPNGGGEPLRCFDHISCLGKLLSLKCAVVNPGGALRLAPFATLPSSLTKLSLVGLGFPWEETGKIAWLPHLKVLKLRGYAFRGAGWRVEGSGFPSLRSLLIEDTDLVELSLGSECFKCLERLSMRHGYKYKNMSGEFGVSIIKIGFFDCNQVGVLQMKEVMPWPWIEWRNHLSFIHGKTHEE